MCCEGEIDEENEEFVKAGEEGPGMSEDELQPERGYSYGSERAATERYPTYRDSGPGATRTELPDAGEDSSASEEALPYDDDFVVIHNKHVGCCYCWNYFFWVTFGGFWMFLFWCLAGVLCFLSIVGITWGCKCFKIACICLVPWKTNNRGSVVKKHIYYIYNPKAPCFGNSLWFIFVAWWLFVLHMVFAALNCVLLFGIPFAYQHVKWGLMCFKCGDIALTLEECEAITGIDAREASDDDGGGQGLDAAIAEAKRRQAAANKAK